MAGSLARSLSRGVAGLDIAACFFRIHLILDFHMLAGPFWKKSIQAPAIQLAEHAQAILADDREMGLTRHDPVVEAIARGSAHGHAAPWLQKTYCYIYFNGTGDGGRCYFFSRYLAMKSAEAMEARTSFRALDDAGLRLPVQLSFNKVGDTARLLDNLLICLNFLLHTCWAIPEQFVMFII